MARSALMARTDPSGAGRGLPVIFLGDLLSQRSMGICMAVVPAMVETADGAQ